MYQCMLNFTFSNKYAYYVTDCARLGRVYKVEKSSLFLKELIYSWEHKINIHLAKSQHRIC